MLAWLLILFALLVGLPAQAHPAPFSYLDLHMGERGVDGTLVVHVIDAAHELKVSPPEALLHPDTVEARQAPLQALVTPRLILRAGDRRLEPQWTGMTTLVDQSALKLSFHLDSAPGALTVDTDLFPYDRYHQTFVNIYEAGRLKQQWIFARSAPPRTYYRGTATGAWEVIKTFVPAGIHHILIGPDHLLFLLGLLLLGGNWKALAKIVTAFTLGHSLTLSLATLGLVTPPASIVEPAIALTIVFVGADNLLRGRGRDLRAWAALAFGLVHGFGFASVLRDFGLPREALGWSLFSFNLGVEFGQLAVVIPTALLLGAIRSRSPQMGYRVAVAGSVMVIIAGAYWFVQRAFFPGGII